MALTFYVKTPDTDIGGIDEYTKLMLHGDESPLVDSSASNQTVVEVGGAARSATQSKFGGYSIDFTGDSNLSVTDSPDFIAGTDWTCDFWIYPTELSNSTAYYHFSQGSGNGEWAWDSWIQIDGAGVQKISLRQVTYNIQRWRLDAACSLNINTWYHIAHVKVSDDWSTYIDGTFINNVTGASSADFGAPLLIGRAAYTPVPQRFKGYMDEFRWSNGIARWTENFTPEGPYTT